MKIKLVGIRWLNNDKEIVLSFNKIWKRWWLFGEERIKFVQYRGSSIKWNIYPSGDKCDTETEEWLEGIFLKEKWNRENNPIEPIGGCPCLYEKPCSPNCSCGHMLLSGGCDRCCTYGSLEQRSSKAKSLIERLKR